MGDMRRQRLDDRSLDEAIRRLVEAAGSDAPDAPTLAGGRPVATAPPARRVHWPAPAFAAAVIAVVVVALVVASGGADEDVATPTDSRATTLSPVITTTEPASTTSTSSSTTVGASRPIGGDAASCVDEYNLATLAGRTWGFDGTVRSIAPLVEGGVDTAVEFDVHEWFGIEGPPTVTVDLVAPQVHSSVEPPDYGVGTRLLVAGEPRWGGDPLDAPVAWSCGFTRTWDEHTASAWRTTFATRASLEPPAASTLTRPVADPAICTSRYARDGVTNGVSLFARRSTSPVPMQVIAGPTTGPTGPFALVQRYFSDETLRLGSETVEVAGITYQLGVFDNGNGSLEWEVGDGSIGYVRSRGPRTRRPARIAAALTPRTPDASVPGFDVDAAALPEPLELLHEQLNTDVSGEVHRSGCVVPGTQLEYRISAISGDPIFGYGGVIDRSVPLAVGMIDGTVVVIDGLDDPVAPTVSDVVNADQATWDELLTRTDAPEHTDNSFDIVIGEPVEVTLLNIDEQVAASTLVLRVVEEPDVSFLQVDTLGAVLHPDAVLWKVEIQGRGGGLSTARVDTVHGYRIGETPISGEINVEISVIDGGDFTLQTTGQIRLVVP